MQEKLTKEELEEFWHIGKERDEKLNAEWDKLSKEEKKELLDDPFYQRMRYEFEGISLADNKIKNRILYKECFIAGVSFHDVDWDELYEGVEVVLVRHKSNKYDKNAIAVVLACDYCGENEEDFDFNYILGYIPREENGHLAMFLDMGLNFECEISRVKRYGPYKERLRIAIYLKNETEKVDNSHLLRVAELDNKEFADMISDLSSRGFTCFRFMVCYPTDYYKKLNLLEEGDKVVFFHKRKNDVVLYLMYTMAVGEESASRFLNDVEVFVDDCTYFIFTNIKGPFVVAHKDIDFLQTENLLYVFRQPNQFISESGSKKLWEMFDKM